MKWAHWCEALASESVNLLANGGDDDDDDDNGSGKSAEHSPHLLHCFCWRICWCQCLLFFFSIRLSRWHYWLTQYHWLPVCLLCLFVPFDGEFHSLTRGAQDGQRFEYIDAVFACLCANAEAKQLNSNQSQSWTSKFDCRRCYSCTHTNTL